MQDLSVDIDVIEFQWNDVVIVYKRIQTVTVYSSRSAAAAAAAVSLV